MIFRFGLPISIGVESGPADRLGIIPEGRLRRFAATHRSSAPGDVVHAADADDRSETSRGES